MYDTPDAPMEEKGGADEDPSEDTEDQNEFLRGQKALSTVMGEIDENVRKYGLIFSLIVGSLRVSKSKQKVSHNFCRRRGSFSLTLQRQQNSYFEVYFVKLFAEKPL